MKLRFIGADGSMGLRHGEVKRISITTSRYRDCIAVFWYKSGQIHECIYESFSSMCKNWTDVQKQFEG